VRIPGTPVDLVLGHVGAGNDPSDASPRPRAELAARRDGRVPRGRTPTGAQRQPPAWPAGVSHATHGVTLPRSFVPCPVAEHAPVSFAERWRIFPGIGPTG
jgi:hypothetical protein